MNYREIIFILLSTYALPSVNSSAFEEPRTCHWGATFVEERKNCIYKCSESMGFIHPIQQKFICTENKDDIRGIPIFSEPNEEGLYDCECKHPDYEDIICYPKKIHQKRTIEQCTEICSNNLVLTFIQNDTRKVYCSEASNITLYNLEYLMLTGIKQSQTSGKFYTKKKCKCGVNMDRKAEKKLSQIENQEKRGGRKYAKPLVKLHHLCHMEEFSLSGKQHCVNKCRSAKAFLGPSNQLICYHDRITADMISSENDDCECGATLMYRTYKEYARMVIPCNPKQTYPEISNCQIYCRKVIKAYIFNSEPSRTVSYCDSRKELPEGIESLEFQAGRWETSVSPYTKKDRRGITCSCGVNSLSDLLEKSTNINGDHSAPINRGNIQDVDGASSSQAVLNLGIRELSKEIEISYPAMIIEENVQNLDCISSSQTHLNPREPSTVPAISYVAPSNPSKINRISFASATNQIPRNESIASVHSSEAFTTRKTTPNSSWSSSMFPAAINPQSTRYSFGSSSYFGEVPNQGTTRSIINLNSSRALINQRNIQNLHVPSSFQSVTNPEITTTSIRNESYSPAATDEIHKRNYRGSASSFEDVTKRRTTHNVFSNDSLLSIVENQISKEDLFGSVSSYEGVTDQRTTNNFNVNASSYKATTILMPDQNSGWNASFFGGGAAERTTNNLNTNATPFEAATNRIPYQNSAWNASFFGSGTAERTTNNLNANATPFQAATNRIPYQNSAWNSSSFGNGTAERTTNNLNANATPFEAATNRIPYQNSAWNASSFGSGTAERTTQKSNVNFINFQPGATQIFKNNSVANASFSATVPYHITQNFDVCASSSKDNILSYQNHTSEEEDDIPINCSLTDLLLDESFDFLPFDVPESYSLRSINDIVPVKDPNPPSQFDQLPQLALQMNTNTFIDETHSLSRRNYSFDSEKIGFASVSTNKNTNYEERLGEIPKDGSINWSPSPNIHPHEVVTSDYVPVADYGSINWSPSSNIHPHEVVTSDYVPVADYTYMPNFYDHF